MERDPVSRARLASTFALPGVADAYQHRPPYPPEVFDLLEGIITDRPSNVLDIGAGEGALARPLASRVDHIDALDVSAAMISAGRRRPGGRRPNLRWMTGSAESAPLHGPYALVTAGACLHWMSWRTTLTRLARAMTAGAMLAIVEHGYEDVPWAAGLADVIARHSRAVDYDHEFSMTGALAGAGLLSIAGRARTAAMPFDQPVGAYIEHFFSTSSLARELMPAQEAAALSQAIADIVRPYAIDGMLRTSVVANLTWGRPIAAG